MTDFEHDHDGLPADATDPFSRALYKMAPGELPEHVKRRHLEALASTPGRRSRLRRPRVVLVILCALGFGSAGLGTAAAFGFLTAPVTDRSMAHCYATADLDTAGNSFDVMVADRPGGTISERDAANLALDICRGAWQQGLLVSEPPFVHDEPDDSDWDHESPPLAGCVLGNGQIAIFPGGAGTCAAIDLPIAEQ